MENTGADRKSAGTLPSGWRFGFDPAVVGSVVRSLSRVELPLGEALRLEIEIAEPGDLVHVQYHVATGSGGWALWVSCPRSELAGCEAALAAIVSPEESQPEA
jgi:hypothetical protein